MNSHDPGIPEVLAALNTLTEEIRSFRQYTKDAWKVGRARAMEREKQYEERYAEQRSQADEQQRSYNRRWKLAWVLNAWFLFVSIMFILWLAQQT